jgi:glucose/mannose-6-phosphate isomerase
MTHPTIAGADRLRSLALQTPEQFLSGFRAGLALAPEAAARTRAAVVVGMGGSGIAGDLMLTLTDAETELALSVVRAPGLPRPATSTTLALLASYSGDTWETLAAFEEAGRRGSPRVVMTSGGRLAERAAEEGVPCLVVPAGGPPRAWVPFVFGGLLGILDGAFPSTNESRAFVSAELLGRHLRSLAATGGLPARLAARLGPRIPLVYAESTFAGLARRWKTQIEENAKRIAGFDAIPELLHNRVVALDAIDRVGARGIATVQLEWSAASAEVRSRFGYLARLSEARGVRTIRVPIAPEDRLDALLHGLAIGDFFTLALARAAHVDPLPVDAIVRMKKALEPKRRAFRAPTGVKPAAATR